MSSISVSDTQGLYDRLVGELRKKIVGQDDIIRLLITGVFANGHCLLIGVPGLAKTLLVKSISESLGIQFNRIQFTPDLMPSDIIGSEILKDRNGQIEFEFQDGPVFTNLLLADEINRTPPKTQAALLEAMQERRVTVAGKSRPLSAPFLVVATQNPIEQEGTYPLPEAQLDRFMFSLKLEYPSRAEEMEIVKQTTGETVNSIEAIISQEEILNIQKLVRAVPVTDHVIQYAVDLTCATRPAEPTCPKVTSEYVEWGAGPRASQFLILGAKATGLLNGRASPEIQDVKAVAASILQHRIVTNYRATGDGMSPTAVINEIIGSVREANYIH